MNLESPQLVVVTPSYEDSGAATQLFKRLYEIYGENIAVVAVDDGSVRKQLNAGQLKATGLNGVVIKLRRNVGHQQAIAVGLNYVNDNFPDDIYVVVMDSDGEDLPESIAKLKDGLHTDSCDIAVAKRRGRIESFNFKTFYLFYKWIFGLLTGRKIDFGNFMVMTAPALKRLAVMRDIWIHLAGGVLNSKLRIAKVPLDRGPRFAGQSKMNFVGLLLHGFRGLMVFAEDVLVRVGIVCALIAAFSVLGALAAIVLKIIGIATPGWFSVALGVLILMFLQTGAITLVTLMLTGVVKAGGLSTIDYMELIDEIEKTE